MPPAEEGDLILPPAVAKMLRRDLATLANTLRDGTWFEVQSADRYSRTDGTLDGYQRSLNLLASKVPEPSAPAKVRQATVRNAALRVLGELADACEPGTLPKPKQADLDNVAPKRGLRADYFPVLGHTGVVLGGITFNGHTVTWAVDGPVKSVREARRSPVGALFFARLDRVVWRNSGGMIRNHKGVVTDAYG